MATDADTLTKTQLEDTPGLHTLGTALDDGESIAVADLFTDDFVADYTDFDSMEELLAASPTDGPVADTVRDPSDDLDEFIAANSEFDSWLSFVGAAGDQFLHQNSGY